MIVVQVTDEEGTTGEEVLGHIRSLQIAIHAAKKGGVKEENLEEIMCLLGALEALFERACDQSPRRKPATIMSLADYVAAKRSGKPLPPV